MGKILTGLFSIFLPAVIFFQQPVFASHPRCNSSVNTTANFVQETDNPESCPTDTCYDDAGPTAPSFVIYACYRNIPPPTPTTAPSAPTPVPAGPTPTLAPITGLPSNRPGVTCEITPETVNINGTFTFNASGLTENSDHRIEANTLVVAAHIRSSPSGRIEATFDPRSLNLGASAERVVFSLYRLPGAGRQFMCTAIVNITGSREFITGTGNFYRCDDPRRGHVCAVYDDFVPGSTDNQSSCDKACRENGTTFAPVINFLAATCKPEGEKECGAVRGIPCDDPDNPGLSTAIGCIHTTPAALTRDMLVFLVTLSGGFAFLMMLVGVFQMLTSGGNPDTLNAGKERMESAVIGLLVVIFAVLLLRIIGVDILGLGKFFGI